MRQLEYTRCTKSRTNFLNSGFHCTHGFGLHMTANYNDSAPTICNKSNFVSYWMTGVVFVCIHRAESRNFFFPLCQKVFTFLLLVLLNNVISVSQFKSEHCNGKQENKLNSVWLLIYQIVNEYNCSEVLLSGGNIHCPLISDSAIVQQVKTVFVFIIHQLIITNVIMQNEHIIK